MMAAGISAGRGKRVVLLEKNNRLGCKLSITGKGRCNLTNNCDPYELLANTPGNPDFLYSAFYSFGSAELMDFFEQRGIKLVTERGRRVFPKSNRAADIVSAMAAFLKGAGVEVRLSAEVKELNFGAEKRVCTDSAEFSARSVIVATGGLAYPATGSTGDGYRFARACGHAVTQLRPSLVPLRAAESWVAELQGLSLKNVCIKLSHEGRVLYEDFGEMIFTHFGVSGPIILSASRFINQPSRYELSIDLKPALTEAQLDSRLLRDFNEYKNKNFANALSDLLPQSLIPVVVKLSGIEPGKKVHDVTRNERKNLVSLLKGLKLTIIGDTGFGEAIITRGGVKVSEIDPSTMESKLAKGVYFAGEVLDVDALTGGYNLQIAFSTGYLAGMSC
jgi:predicted Rossmann fold flavoprotein